MREGEGDLSTAISLYMKAGLPARAAHLVMQHEVSRKLGRCTKFSPLQHSLSLALNPGCLSENLALEKNKGFFPKL